MVSYVGSSLRFALASCCVLLTLITGAIAQTAQAPLPRNSVQGGGYTVNLDDKSIGIAHLSLQNLAWFIRGTQAVLGARIKIRPYLDIDDAKLDNRVYYVVAINGLIDSYADYDAGNPRIMINSGLIRAIDELAWAEVMGAEYDDHECFLNYFRYATHQSRGPIQSPSDFAIKHVDMCPVECLSLMIHRSSAHDKTVLQEYSDFARLGLSFVILHEFAHIKRQDSDIKSGRLGARRKEEIIADKFAARHMQNMGANPVLALPVLLLVARLEGQKQSDVDKDHPPVLKRMQRIIALSKRLNKSIRSTAVTQSPSISQDESKIASSYTLDLLAEAPKKWTGLDTSPN